VVEVPETAQQTAALEIVAEEMLHITLLEQQEPLILVAVAEGLVAPITQVMLVAMVGPVTV
jgi:hypothetical protein